MACNGIILEWAAGDAQCRGFLIGATSGRTTLAGEGLQHQDGQSLVMASTIPNCVSYDPSPARVVLPDVAPIKKPLH